MEITRFSIHYTKSAETDLRHLFTYIQQTESKNRALYVVNGIMETVNKTTIFPSKHRIEPLLNRSDIRFTVKWSYKILFQIKESSIIVLRIFHTKQHPNKLVK